MITVEGQDLITMKKVVVIVNGSMMLMGVALNTSHQYIYAPKMQGTEICCLSLSKRKWTVLIVEQTNDQN